jgi:hypothetical protein
LDPLLTAEMMIFSSRNRVTWDITIAITTLGWREILAVAVFTTLPGLNQNARDFQSVQLVI